MEQVNALSKTAESFVRPVLQNPYVMAGSKILLVLYAAQLAPRLPDHVTAMFKNSFVKMAAVFIIAFLAQLDFQLAILLAVVFVPLANVMSGRGLLESYANFSVDYTPDGNIKLLEPKSHIYPGCQDITLKELEQVFEGNPLKLQETLRYAYRELLRQAPDKSSKEKLMQMAYAVGLPHNININEENAPLIATMLLYAGFKVSDKCIVPQQ
jgi:hypothetical protein